MRPSGPSPPSYLEQGRQACYRREWRTAHERLTRADAEEYLRTDERYVPGEQLLAELRAIHQQVTGENLNDARG